MSHGPGIVERSIVRVFAEDADAMLDSITIAARALGKSQITESEAGSYRRALRRLARRGELTDLGRQWRFGRRCYALPAAAERIRQRHRQTFGSDMRIERPLRA